MRSKWVWLASAAFLLCNAPAARADDEGFNADPSLYWKAGDSRIDLNLASRYRLESWDAYVRNADSFWGLRNRLKLTFTWREKLQLVGEVQDVRVASMDSNGTGVLATYRNAAEGDYNAHGT